MATTKGSHSIRTSTEGLVALSSIRHSPEWAGLIELKNSFIEKYKNDAFTLDESNPEFPIKHAQISSKVIGIIDFLDFIDKSPGRLEDKFVEQVKEEQFDSLVNG